MPRTARRAPAAALCLFTLVLVSACAEDGSGATPDSTDQSTVVAFVPKLQGIAYFDAMDAGGVAASESIDDVVWRYKGPDEADPPAQADVVRSFVEQGIDTIVVAPNDPASMAPVLAEAVEAGVHVLTADTDAPDSVREAFVSQASAQGVGEAITDSLLEAMGGRGEYAIVSCGRTAENLNSWIEVQRAYTAERYPDAEIVDVVYAGEDEAEARRMATGLMREHPDLTGLVGECTTSAPGVAAAVRDAGRIGEVFTVGVGTPLAMEPYLVDGSSSTSVLWDVEDLGYLTAWAGQRAAHGAGFEPTADLLERLPDVTWDEASKTLLLGPPLVITAANAGDFSY